jgi:hypothetical protein
MSKISELNKERYDTPKVKFALDVRYLKNFRYDMDHCIKCKGGYWVDHTYSPGIKFTTRCPSGVWNDFDAYNCAGKMRIGSAVDEGLLEWTPKLLEVLYADPLCGACDVGCKRNLDLEIGLSLEALRVKAVKDGAGPMPAHKKTAENIEKTHNQFGSPHANRRNWLTQEIKVADKADVLYFPGCSASYTNPEIGQATAKILNASGTPFSLMPDEWCCGNTLYSVGMIDEATELAKRNVDAVKASGAKTRRSKTSISMILFILLKSMTIPPCLGIVLPWKCTFELTGTTGTLFSLAYFTTAETCTDDSGVTTMLAIPAGRRLESCAYWSRISLLSFTFSFPRILIKSSFMLMVFLLSIRSVNHIFNKRFLCFSFLPTHTASPKAL